MILDMTPASVWHCTHCNPAVMTQDMCSGNISALQLERYKGEFSRLATAERPF